jgi:predicted O-methyltransferase YrrM
MSEDLIQKWRAELDAVQHLNDWDSEPELSWIAEQASRASFVLEAGSFKGASTKIMVLANPNVKIVCLDDWADPGVLEIFQEALKDEIESGRVTMVRGNTTDGFNNLPEGFEPDFTFIDAGHLYPDVEHDIRRTLEIQKKGIISGHDYRHDIPSDGVNKAVHEAFPLGVDFPADSIWAYEIA